MFLRKVNSGGSYKYSFKQDDVVNDDKLIVGDYNVVYDVESGGIREVRRKVR